MSAETTPPADAATDVVDAPAPVPAEQVQQADEPQTQTPPAPPAPDSRDETIERLTRIIMERERAPAAPAGPAPKAPMARFEETLRGLGFGNVGGTDTEPGVNEVPALMKAFEEYGKIILGHVDNAVSPRLSAIGAEIVGTKFERELAVRVQKQTPEFLRFRDAELAKGGVLAVLRTDAPVEAAELITARWRAQLRDVKHGDVRRNERLEGADLQGAAPRGGNSAGAVLRVRADDPNISEKLCRFADAGGDAKNIKWLKRGEK